MNEMSWKPKEWRRLDNCFDAIRIRQFGQPTQKEKKKAIFDEEDKSTHGDKTTLNKKKKKEEERGRPRWISSLWNISLASVSKTKHARVVEKQFTVDKIFRSAMACQWSCCAKLFTQRHLLSTWFSFGDDIFRYVDRASKYCATEKKTTTSCCQTSGSKWFNFHHYLHLCAKRIPKADKLRTQLSVEQHKLNYDANSGISERHRRHRSVYNVTTKK